VSLLGRVCWPDVLDALLASTPELPGDVALYLQPHAVLSPRHRVLAVCAVRAGPAGCAAAAGDIAGGWLYNAALIAHRGLSPAARRTAFPRFTGWLRQDPALPGLPLLCLAAAHAERSQQPLIVIAADLRPLALGRITRRAEVTIGGRHTIATLIELSDVTPDTWCHELGHAVDPVDPRLDAVTAEAFADTLGALLLTERPDSLAELDTLIARAETEINQRPTPQCATGSHDAPATTTVSTNDIDVRVESLFAFAKLDLRGWRPK
jgi:hypothetical protein